MKARRALWIGGLFVLGIATAALILLLNIRRILPNISTMSQPDGYLTDHSWDVSLTAVVDQSLVRAAQLVEVRDASGALREIQKTPVTSYHVDYEMHYLKGLCLQLQGRSTESREAYEFVISHATDVQFKERAKLGISAAEHDIRTIPPEMLRFSSEDGSRDNAQ